MIINFTFITPENGVEQNVNAATEALAEFKKICIENEFMPAEFHAKNGVIIHSQFIQQNHAQPNPAKMATRFKSAITDQPIPTNIPQFGTKERIKIIVIDNRNEEVPFA